jgi:hypothetical protein
MSMMTILVIRFHSDKVAITVVVMPEQLVKQIIYLPAEVAQLIFAKEEAE